MVLRSRRGQRHRVARVTALVVIFAVALALGSWSSLASATTQRIEGSHAKRGSGLVKQTSIALGSCSAKDVVMRVVIDRSTYASSQPVDVIAVVRNISKTLCTYGGTGGSSNQYMGPCGALSMTVLNSRGLDIWPGPVAYHCPMIGPTHLAPGAQVIATGTWPKLAVTRRRTTTAPPGVYRLIIERRITLTISLK
jgi:hypothetical protein